MNAYRTTELELAAYLKAKGHPVREAVPQGRIVMFLFDDAVVPDVDAYFAGAQIVAQDLFEAYRSLRMVIQQAKVNQLNKKDQINYEYRINQ
jgi:hypothetical protein